MVGQCKTVSTQCMQASGKWSSKGRGNDRLRDRRPALRGCGRGGMRLR